MTVEELVRQFRDAAIEKATAPVAKDQALHAEMSKAWRQLHALGPKGQEAFKALLRDNSRHVRAWVAAQLLWLGDQSGVGVLQADAELDDIDGFGSSMVLKEWKAGRLGPPLGSLDA